MSDVSIYVPSSIDALLRAYESFITGDTARFEAAKIKVGQYRYIPLDQNTFHQQLQEVIKLFPYIRDWDKNPKFIDVGCGIGSKVFLAQQRGFTAYGIEITPKYVEIARKLVAIRCSTGLLLEHGDEKAAARIFQGDAIEHSYKDYDVIYFYCPLSDHKLEAKLEARIRDTAKSGAFVIANNFNHSKWSSDKRFRPIGSEGQLVKIFRKI